MSGAMASSLAIRHAIAAKSISRGCGLRCSAMHSAQPQPAAMPMASGMITIIRTRALVLVDSYRVPDQQIHASGQADHHSNQRSVAVPAIASIQPAANEKSQHRADGDFQSDADQPTPLDVLVVAFWHRMPLCKMLS